MNLRITWPWWKYATAAFIGIGASVGFRAYQDSGPSVIVDSLIEADDVVRAGPEGDTISFVIKLDRQFSCPSMVSRYVWHWIDWKDHQIRDFHSIDNPPLSPMPGKGEHEFMLTLRVQGSLPPGPWFERTVTMPECSLFPWWTTAGRNTPRVEDRPIRVE